jgi:hypothetical protein
MRLNRLALLSTILSVSVVQFSCGQNHFGKLPSYFEENRGQAPADVKYLSKGLGYTQLFREHDSSLQDRLASRSPAGIFQKTRTSMFSCRSPNSLAIL